MKPTRPTLRTLAEEAGVSAMTFSLALRNRPEIPLSTRERLQRLAKARGYKPDPTIAKLMQHLRTTSARRGSSNICGIRYGEQLADFRGGFGEGIEAGVRSTAELLGFNYETLEVSTASRKRLGSILRNRGIEGVILLPMPVASSLESLLDWGKFSVVAATASVLAPQFHNVTPQHFDNVLHAYRQLAETGYKRIGLAISQAWNERVRFRWSGAMAWHNYFGQTEPVPPFLGTSPGSELRDERFVEWVRKFKPDAILVERVAPALLKTAVAKLPAAARPTLVSINWDSSHDGPGIDQKPEVIGGVAVEILAGMIYRGEKGIPANPQHIAVNGEWKSG
jgi:LacI family transcriptional regulator